MMSGGCVEQTGRRTLKRRDDDGHFTRLFTLLYGGSSVFAPLGGAVADRFGVGFGQGVATVLTAVSFVILLSPTLDFLQILAGSLVRFTFVVSFPRVIQSRSSFLLCEFATT